jgi:hypothetical protein
MQKIKSFLEFLSGSFSGRRSTSISEIDKRGEILAANAGKKLSLRVLAEIFGHEHPRTRKAKAAAIRDAQRFGFYVEKTRNQRIGRLISKTA